MSPPEAALRYLEEHIPELADAALRQAYWQALAAGSQVLVGENDHLVEVSPDGTRRVLGPLPPDTPAEVGQRFVIP